MLPGVLYVSAEINTDRVEFHKAAFSAQRERTAECPGEKMSQISTKFFIFFYFEANCDVNVVKIEPGSEKKAEVFLPCCASEDSFSLS